MANNVTPEPLQTMLFTYISALTPPDLDEQTKASVDENTKKFCDALGGAIAQWLDQLIVVTTTSITNPADDFESKIEDLP